MPVTPDEHFAQLEAMDGKKPENKPRIPVGGPDGDRPVESPTGEAPAVEPLVREPHLLELLREVIDPELGVDIVGLGLLRGARIDGRVAHVAFTVTMPACPMSDYIEDEIRRCLLTQPEIDEVAVSLVNDPPWSAADMNEEVRTTLGWTS